MSNGTAIPIPDDWDQLDDTAKDRAAAEMLKRVADETGVNRGEGRVDQGESASARPARTFREPR